MHRLPKTRMLGARSEMRLDNPPVGFKPKLQSDGIGFAADKTRSGVRKRFHHHNRPRGEGRGKRKTPSSKSQIATKLQVSEFQIDTRAVTAFALWNLHF